jgi:hypothetical protein
MSAHADFGNLTPCNITGRNMIVQLNASDTILNACSAPTAAISGTSNSAIHIRSNCFTNPTINRALFVRFTGRVIDYDTGITFNYTVANLPTASSIFKGLRMFVTDSTVAAFGNFAAIVVGGGTNTVPVFCDDTNWRIG